MQKSMIKLLSIADVVTLTNAIFGFLAIIMVFRDEVRFSFSFILLALLADGLDGIVARKTRKSDLGEYLEAMADMTSLGIAPAVFVYATYNDIASCCVYYHGYLIAVLILFLSFSVIRLASFHIMKDDGFFVGLPASASTSIILILAFLQVEFLYILLVILFVSFALISNVHFPNRGIVINIIATFLILLTLFIGEIYWNIAPIALLLAILVYAIVGPVYLWSKKTKFV